MILNPDDLTLEQVYGLLVNVVVPRPIALVSTVSESGHRNLAPFSYFNIGGMEPPSLVVCPGPRPNGEPKDTLINAEETGEFCVNLVTRAMADGMNQSSRGLPPGEDEWLLTGLTPVASDFIRAPRIAESPVALECVTCEIVSVGTGTYLIGVIERIHLAEGLWDEAKGELATTDVPLIARLGGPRYLDLGTLSTFELTRPH